MKIIAVANQKGGVGKSTTTFHLATALITLGYRVLIVDADPQGNLTSVLSAEDVDPRWVGLADVLAPQTEVTIVDALIPGVWPGLTILPTPKGSVLGMVRDQLVAGGPGRERRLADALAEVAGDYDVCLIDCPPSLDQLTINALTAAAAVLIVTQAKLFAANGMHELLATIAEVRRYYNEPLTVAGVVVNLYEARQITARERYEALQAAARGNDLVLFDPPVPKRVIIGDALESSTQLDQWGSEGKELAEIYTGYARTLMNGAR